MSITIKNLADGRTVLSGKTFDIKDKIKELKGMWNPEEKTWTLPAGTDISWLRPPAPPKPAAVPLQPVYRPLRRDKLGRCCAAAVFKLDDINPYGPMVCHCATHGVYKSDYAGT